MAAYTPPAPHLSGDAQLDVFAHHSQPTALREPYGDGNRLVTLGRPMLAAAYAAAVLQARPDIHGLDFQVSAEGGLPGFASLWVENYGWAARMLAVPPGVDLNNPQESLRILQTYAGAVVQAHGDHALFDWIALLV
ncbi:hypothetical protein C8Q76DRAFT_623860 [Earliella scabrosa]|nr:hypothetical protein C8Q76DRAFT_623860 [Earliella scabrosa]